MKTFRTLCSGGELFGVGARAAGWQHVEGFEIEAPTAAVARLNGFTVNVTDVCAVDYAALAPVDHLHASPSCKSASQANTDGGECDEDKAVADAVCRAIRAHQGKTFSLENVWGYRNYESFARILAALHSEGFQVDYRHVNAADYGVPQTRKRLILRAVRGARVPPLHPTHRRGGDMFHAAWRGWYEAIEDLLPFLPDTTPAPWQMARLSGKLTESVLIHPTDMRTMPICAVDDPAFTVMAGSFTDSHRPGWNPRAFVISNAATEYGDGLRDDAEPMFSVTTQHAGRLRALLIDSSNTSREPTMLEPSEPSMAVQAWHGRRPSHMPMVASGTWKRLTVQALGRFQTVPDNYIGLTPQINGNGVCCLLAQRIMESLP